MAKPEKRFRIGSVSASVFLNEAKGKRPFRSVALERRFKKGNQWQSSSSFALNELPAAVAVLQVAMNHVVAEDLRE